MNYLLRALELAKQRQGFTAPNPAVGAVIVKDNQIIAEGTHWQAGDPHAEAAALIQAGDAANGATIYVTLEPCNHVGKTPPCTQAIIDCGIKKVIYGYADPNLNVAGLGAKYLQQSGIDVEFKPLDEIKTFYTSYAYWLKYKKPFMTSKLAMSLDGKIAGVNGSPIAITGSACLAFTHKHRLHSDAILTTVKTVNCDDPQFNIRLGVTEPVSKPIFVIDRNLSINNNLKLWDTAKTITLFHSAEADKSNVQHLNINFVMVNETNGQLDLNEIIAYIGECGYHDCWIEAGPNLFARINEQALAQTSFIYIAAKALGNDALSAFDQLHQLKKPNATNWLPCGDDVICKLNYYNE